jgi:hypothetical protein
MPYRSAIGFENFFSGGLPGFGIGAMPASQLAQCQASALFIALALTTNVFG